MDTFATVCVANIGQAKDQIETAKSTFNAKDSDVSNKAQTHLISRDYAFDVVDDESATCAITSQVEETITFDSFVDDLSNKLGGNEPNEIIEPNTAYWLIEPHEAEGNFAISLMVASKQGQNLATVMISKLEGPIE
ncbi:MAG: hypothetical protein ABJP70_08700 [Erythrobacter sp.]